MRFALLSWLCLLFPVAYSILEEQAGELEWKIDGIGEIVQSVNKNRRLYVATAEGVLASLHTNSSIENEQQKQQLLWRVKLPTTTIIHQLVIGKVPSGSFDLFTISSVGPSLLDNQQPSPLFMLSAWSADRGTLQWQVPVGSNTNKDIDTTYTDLVYDASRFLVTALSGNAIDVYTTRGLPVMHWSPATSQDNTVIATQSNKKKRLVLSQLVVPLDVVDHEQDAAQSDKAVTTRLAIGCFVSNKKGRENKSNNYGSPMAYYTPATLSAQGKCSGPVVVLSTTLPTKAAAKSSRPTSGGIFDMALDLFPALDVAPVTLRGALSSRGDVSFAFNDVVFGYQIVKGISKMLILNLANKEVVTVEFPLTHPVKGASMLGATRDGDILPLIMSCGLTPVQGQGLGKLEGEHGQKQSSNTQCEVYVVATKKASTGATYELNPLTSCGKRQGSGAVLGVDRHPSFGAVTSAVSCITGASETDTPAASDRKGASSAGKATAAASYTISTTRIKNVKGASSTHSFIADLNALVPGVSQVTQQVAYVTSTEEAQGPGLAPGQGKEEGKGKGKSGSVAKVLIVFAEGTTLLMEHAPGQESSVAASGAVNGVSIVWWRDEAYTRLRQAIVVDDARSSSHLHAHGSSSNPEGGNQQLPGLQERLEMQREDLLQMLSDFQTFALSLPHTIMAHALTGFGMLAKAPNHLFSNQDPATLGMGLDHLAIMRRRSKRGRRSLEQAKLARRFGFNKIAVGLTAKVPIGGVTSGDSVDDDVVGDGAGGSRIAVSAQSLGPLSDHQGGFEAAHIKLVGVDLVSGDEIWCLNPSRSSANVLAPGAGPTVDAQGLDSDIVSLARLVTLHSSMLETKVALIVSMKSGLTLSWSLDASNGRLLPQGPSDVNNDSKGPVTSILALGTYGEARKGDLQYLLVYSSPSLSTSEAETGLPEGLGIELGSDIVAQLFPSAPASAALGQYVHQVDVASGLVASYQLSSITSRDVTSTSASVQLRGEPVGSTRFPKIAAVAYPAHDDVVDSRSSVLGDNSILLEYINPHVMLVAYFSDAPPTPVVPVSVDGVDAPTTATATSATTKTSTDINIDGTVNPQNNNNDVKKSDDSSSLASTTTTTNTTPTSGSSASDGQYLYAAIVDTVSAKIVYRMLLNEYAAGPVHALLVENHFVISYWNAKAKRTELCSAALFEGMVDVFGLSPLTSFRASPQLQKEANLSAYSSPAPLSIQRTYVVPRAITSLHHTVTSRGLSHKNVLVGIAGGQLFSLDYRFIHPRRPLTAPTNTEREEGLMQFNPYIHLIPQLALTQDEVVLGDISHVTTAPVRLESTSLVLMYGGLDIYFTRTSPSQGFDVLSPDFNHPLLIFLLVALAILVLWLRRAHVKKTLSMTWA